VLLVEMFHAYIYISSAAMAREKHSLPGPAETYMLSGAYPDLSHVGEQADDELPAEQGLKNERTNGDCSLLKYLLRHDQKTLEISQPC
jgi:hypothetical protein